jgi:hypothetical protein
MHITLPAPLGTFHPCSYRHLEMDDITFMCKDECSINHSLLVLRLEPLRNKCGRLHGFTLIGAEMLLRRDERTSMLRLLLRAFISDIRPKYRIGKVSLWQVVKLYAAAALLLLRHPNAWRLS